MDILDIRDFGAAEDASPSANAAAIQAALDAAASAGGGMAVVPPGTFTTGTIRLRSHAGLHLEKGAVLKGSTHREDYNANNEFPENFWSASEEWSGGHLILGYKVEDVAITGEGTIDGSGLSFFGEPDEDSRFPHYKYGLRLHTLDREWFRPGPLVAFFLSRNIRLDGINIVDSPCWTTHFRCCDGLEIHGVSIRNDRTMANTDGFSIDCTRNVSVSHCTVVTGDDTVAIRASCKIHAAEHPCENITIEDCDFSSCAMGIRIGIGSGTIRDVAIRNIRVHEAANGIQFHPAWIPGAKGCYIERVKVSDCDIAQCDFAVSTLGGADDWRIRDITFERCRFESLRPATLRGDASRHPENIVFRDCTRTHLDHLKVRHHRFYCGERSRDFLQVEGVAEGLVVENCMPRPRRSGSLILSFDGNTFADWIAALPLFEKFSAHATFFASGPINEAAVRTLKRLSEAGHSVGLSGLAHLNADEALAAMGAERYWKEEIDPQHSVCRVSYIPVKSFAYPNGRRTEETDAFFREKGFEHLLGGNHDRGTIPAAELPSRFWLEAKIADDVSPAEIEDILACIRRCAERNEAFALTSSGPGLLAKGAGAAASHLERILAAAHESGLAIVGLDELR